jgi:hypothetical protein
MSRINKPDMVTDNKEVGTEMSTRAENPIPPD